MDEKQANEQLSRLISEHRLTFTHNPGGGELHHRDYGRLQLHLQDTREDLRAVEAWLDAHRGTK